MKRRLLFSTFACLILFNVVLGVRFYTAHAAGGDADSGYAQISVFAKAVQLLRQDYVDGNKTSYHDLIYAAMKGCSRRSIRTASSWIRTTSRTCRTTPGAGSTASASRSRSKVDCSR